MQNNHSPATSKSSRTSSAEYGVLESRNIEKVVFGHREFDTWYGNGAYFQNYGDHKLGIDPESLTSKRRAASPANSGFWVDKLYVCEFCFKYTTLPEHLSAHVSVCSLNKPFPPIGKLLYADMKTPYLIKKVRGFRHLLFCQNLSLFGKLFLVDKSVFYNVEAFDFYVIYGYDPESVAESPAGSALRNFFRPMGFFSKEVNSWEQDNNLACVCIFPPYQRLRLGSLLIEFSYALAAVTPGQLLSGPEFPLSPFGKIVYLQFWAKRLAFVLSTTFSSRKSVTLEDLAMATGFRKEDTLMTLEHMQVIVHGPSEELVLLQANLQEWCRANKVDSGVLAAMMNPDCLLF